MSGSAYGAQTVFGYGEESPSAWGTPVVPSRFAPILPGETLRKAREVIQSMGIKPTPAGQRPVLDGNRRRVSTASASGNVKQEMLTRGHVLLFKHIFGKAPVTTLLAPGVYQHVFTLGPQLNKSLTLQKQIRDGEGSVIKCLTYPGSKPTMAEWSIAVGQLLQLSVDYDCRDEIDSVAPAVASYGDGVPFSFQDGALYIDDDEIGLVSMASAKIENMLKTDRYFLNNKGRKDQQTENGNANLTGSLTAEIDNSFLYDAYSDDTSLRLKLNFEGDDIGISGIASAFSLEFTDVHLMGESPAVASTDVVTVKPNWEAYRRGSVEPVTATLITADAA